MAFSKRGERWPGLAMRTSFGPHMARRRTVRPRHSDVKLHAHLARPTRPTNTIRRARGYLHIAIVCVLLTSGIRDCQLQHSRTRWRTHDRRPRARENAGPTVRIGRRSSTRTSIPLAKRFRLHLVGTSDVCRGLRRRGRRANRRSSTELKVQPYAASDRVA